VENVTFREVKGEIRVLGIDDAPFKFKGGEKVPLIGVVFRGGDYLEGVLKTEIQSDGEDATDMIVGMVNASRHREQLRIIMLDGVTFGGFNVADIRRIFEETGLPVITVTRKKPDMPAVKEALKHLPNWEERYGAIKNAGEIHELHIGSKSIFIQACGIGVGDAEKVVKLSLRRGLIPEPVRVAHLIASGITKGESKGRA